MEKVRHLNNINGQDLPKREVAIQAVGTDGQDKDMNLTFQVADCRKPLLSVRRIVEHNNVVQFRPKEEDNFIANKTSGNKVGLKRTGTGSYVMEVDMAGQGRTWITVDSGAEESVCPKDWGHQFAIRPIKEEDRINFRSACGGQMGHHGQRTVRVTSPF